MATSSDFELSEFSVYEILYMGSEPLTFIVHSMLDEAARDPFDIVAEREEHLARPLALIT